MIANPAERQWPSRVSAERMRRSFLTAMLRAAAIVLGSTGTINFDLGSLDRKWRGATGGSRGVSVGRS
ncbi:MAG TPA: hypothetical protein VL157_07890 [Gemmatimonadaceae bacterium]|jgi:hypothetical protein|nr:hypothetical protein [Gemmatimonadaceae bacterium]